MATDAFTISVIVVKFVAFESDMAFLCLTYNNTATFSLFTIEILEPERNTNMLLTMVL